MPVNVNLNEWPQSAMFGTSAGGRRKHMTKEDVFEYALHQLGFPVVEVEIEAPQLSSFLSLAFDVYNKFKPVLKMNVLKGVSSSINSYNLRDLNIPYGRGVVDAVVVSRDQFFSPISGVFALGIPHPISHLSPDQYDLALRYINEAKKVYSSTFEWDWEDPILLAHAPSGLGGAFSIAYTYVADAQVPDDIPAYDHAWFKKYFYSHVMLAVGEGRVKFDTVPGPFIQKLNGDLLVRRADEKIAALDLQIENESYAYTPPLGPSGKY